MEQPGFKYVSIVLGTAYLLPQIYHGHQTHKLSDVSTLSMVMLTSGSMTWAYYMYSVLQEQYFAYATAFVGFCSFYILCQKYWYYVMYLRGRIREVEGAESAV
mgnify:CR=1 FL=1